LHAPSGGRSDANEERVPMVGRTKTKALKKNATSSKDLAVALARDRKFRKQLRSAAFHGSKARGGAV
jgi:hypothetical protein